MNPYDYENRAGLLPISWNDFHGICRALAAAIADYQPETILPIGRGGFYPGTLISHMLRTEVYPIRVSRRVNDVVTHSEPQWLLRPPDLIKGQRVLIVDEISSTGGTLAMVKAALLDMGAAEVRSAVLYAHSWGADIPDYIGVISDAMILNPWDREVYLDGKTQLHPEYTRALAEQGHTPDERFLIPAQAYQLAKAVGE